MIGLRNNVAPSGAGRHAIRGRVPSWRLTAVAVASIMFVSCAGASHPNVVLVLIDTLRADRLGAWGNQRHLTPFLDELATHATVFLNAYSTTSYTTPAVASLFTSRYPSQHHVVNYDSRLDEGENTLSEQFLTAGYRAGGFAANTLLGERGFDQGFEYWFQHWARIQPVKVRAPVIHQACDQWLEEVASESPRPLFLYLHFMEPHAPYEPAQKFRDQLHLAPTMTSAERAAAQKTAKWNWKTLTHDEGDMLAALYDGEVAALDVQLRAVFTDLRARGVLDGAIVAIVADHGEELMEHGEVGHGRSLYDELIRIPLMIAAPDRDPAIVHENVSLVDVMPTLLELSGVPIPATCEGRSLTGELGPTHERRSWRWLVDTLMGSRKQTDVRPVLVELERSNAQYDLRHHFFGVIDGSVKVLVGPNGTETYTRGPEATAPIVQSTAPDAEVAPLIATAEALRKNLSLRAAGAAPTRALDAAEKEKMRALGYDPG
jgi:arylsulfatase